jgi:hypothetical protein
MRMIGVLGAGEPAARAKGERPMREIARLALGSRRGLAAFLSFRAWPRRFFIANGRFIRLKGQARAKNL